ncbi:hypothetical protein E4U53_002249 [Claviceps sorghi]|nr:hypothetical protein E4U53_002249 [Claviceps sorghi]
MKYIPFGLAFASAAAALAGPYERCGGKGWYGPTTCAAGFTCQVSNEFYSQCVAVPFNDDGTRSGAYGQCGGKTWNGTTICLDGYRCQYVNDWYSQCVLNSAAVTGSPTGTSSPGSTQPPLRGDTSLALPTGTGIPTPVNSAAPTSTPQESAGKLKWLGVVESGAEFTPGKFPGVEGTDYTFPDEEVIDGLIKEGYNIFRIPFAMERLAAPSISSPLQAEYLKGLKEIVDSITKQGKHAVLDAHNYGRYHGKVIADIQAFQTFWKNLAGEFRDNANVIFDINNEYHDMNQTLVLRLNQAGIDGIRESGATAQYIFAEGNSYSGTRTWVSTNDNQKHLVDPQNKLVLEMHQYLDADASGKGTDCPSATIGAERLASATKWLRDNNKVGVVGEFAAGPNAQCKAAVEGMLTYLEDNSDVWLGALWWGGGPWWHEYMYSFEAPNGVAYRYYNEVLKQFLP